MIRSLVRLLSVPDKLALLALVRGMRTETRLAVTSALLRGGVLEHLDSPRTLEALAEATGIEELAVLHHLLELGVKRGVLRRRGDRYAARGRLARLAAREPHGPVASMLAEVTTFHLEVLQRVPARLRGAPPQPYLDRFGALVARSSRILEPWIRSFMTPIVGSERGRRILEIGCGSGAYLIAYAEQHPGHAGVGLDLDAAVVTEARELVAAAGLAERIGIEQVDVRDAEAWPEGPFDVVTAHQNVYYFDAAQRAALWSRCREHLVEGGQLAIVTGLQGGPFSDHLGLLLHSTVGCHDLPSVADIVAELEAAGFELERRERLVPGDAIWGFAARKPVHRSRGEAPRS